MDRNVACDLAINIFIQCNHNLSLTLTELFSSLTLTKLGTGHKNNLCSEHFAESSNILTIFCLVIQLGYQDVSFRHR